MMEILATRTAYRNESSFCGPISVLERLANGELLLVFREARRSDGKGMMHAHETTRTSLLRSSDGGVTWHSHVTPDTGGGNGTAVTQLSDGTVVVNNFHWRFVPWRDKASVAGEPGYRELPDAGFAIVPEGVFVTRSITGGYTWDTPRPAGVLAFRQISTAARLVELPDGALLMPVTSMAHDGNLGGSAALISTDRAQTWALRSVIVDVGVEPGFTETRMLRLPGGELLATHRTRDDNFFLSRSTDDGHTWGAPERTPIWCGGSSPGDLLPLADGRVLLTVGHRREPYGVRACVSANAGCSWDAEPEIVLRDDGLDKDMGYPSTIQLSDGSLLTVYYWYHEDGVRHLVSTHWRL